MSFVDHSLMHGEVNLALKEKLDNVYYSILCIQIIKYVASCHGYSWYIAVYAQSIYIAVSLN